MYKFHIVIPFYNAENFIEKCISSVKGQNFKNYKVTIINDCSTDKSKEKIIPLIKGDERFKLINNKKNCGALENISTALNYKINDPEKIINVLIDGDDYLSSSDVLDIVNIIYKRTKCLITYGSFIRKSNKSINGRKYPYRVIINKQYRKFSWLASHLRTFRHDLYCALNQDDLKNKEGKFYSAAWDVALMLPMLEMAGFRQEHISDPLYVYNDINPLCDHFVHKDDQDKYGKEITSKPPYELIILP